MRFDWGGGTREDLVHLGEALRGGQGAALAEEVLKIRNRLGRTVPLAANAAQRQYERCARRSNIVLKARQVGITTWVAGQFFLRTVTQPGTVTVQVAHTQEAAEQIFRIVHRFLRRLPKGMREGALRSAQISARRMVFPELDSEYLVETAGDRNAGRGLTVTNLHCTELARWPGDPAETLAGLRATLSPAGTLVMESTPQGAAGGFWKEWQEAEKRDTARHFFPWWMEEAYRAEPVAEGSLTEEERRLMAEHGLTPEQIGYRRGLRERFRGLAKQEYAEDANSCFLASGECCFEVTAIEKRLAEVRPPLAARSNGELLIWLPPQPGRKYVAGVDPAGGGTEGDYSVVQVIDLEQGLQCAELRGHRTQLELARETAALAEEYGQALVAVERNNHGSGVLAYLAGTCRYPRLYTQNGAQGWLTTTVTRPAMLAGLGSALVESPWIFASERLLVECRSFVRHANGQTGAMAGEHDDCVMAMALALAVRAETLGGR